MGKKDLAQKYLIEKDDVFADIINVLLGNGQKLLEPGELESKPTEAVYYNQESDELKDMFRDVCKKSTKNGQVYAIFGIEAQETMEYTMPLRCMGYDYISYKTQKDKILERRKQEGIKNPRFRKDDRLVPVVTLVLNYNASWNAPISLYDMLDIPDSIEKSELIIPDYRINLISLGSLEPEILEKFQSDFQIVAAYVRYKEEPEKLRQFFTEHQNSIRHPLEVQKAIALVSDEKRYLEYDLEKEEVGNMCKLYDMVLNEGINQGISQGISQGINQERNSSVLKMIVVLRDLNCCDADIREILKKNYELTDEQSELYMAAAEV